VCGTFVSDLWMSLWPLRGQTAQEPSSMETADERG
jgi:hypothetical protein